MTRPPSEGAWRSPRLSSCKIATSQLKALRAYLSSGDIISTGGKCGNDLHGNGPMQVFPIRRYYGLRYWETVQRGYDQWSCPDMPGMLHCVQQMELDCFAAYYIRSKDELSGRTKGLACARRCRIRSARRCRIRRGRGRTFQGLGLRRDGPAGSSGRRRRLSRGHSIFRGTMGRTEQRMD
jgi:hypothetical protein